MSINRESVERFNRGRPGRKSDSSLRRSPSLSPDCPVGQAIPMSFWNDPARRSQGKGLKSMIGQVNKVAYRFAIKFQSVNSKQLVEFNGLMVGWQPLAGA